MPFPDHVRDALLRVHTAHRALDIARTVKQREHLAAQLPETNFLIDDIVTALVSELEHTESALTALITAQGGEVVDPVHGHVLRAVVNDRRNDPRPRFILTRYRGVGASSPAQQRQYERARS